jgi:hypothetical protein
LGVAYVLFNPIKRLAPLALLPWGAAADSPHFLGPLGWYVFSACIGPPNPHLIASLNCPSSCVVDAAKVQSLPFGFSSLPRRVESRFRFTAYFIF